jgi:hypothetical protein
MDLKLLTGCLKAFLVMSALTAPMRAATVGIAFSHYHRYDPTQEPPEIDEPFTLSGPRTTIVNPPVTFSFIDGPIIESDYSAGDTYERYGPGGTFAVSGSLFSLPPGTVLLSGSVQGGEYLRDRSPFGAYGSVIDLNRSLRVNYVHPSFLEGLGLSQWYRGGSGTYSLAAKTVGLEEGSWYTGETTRFNLATPEPPAAWLGLAGLTLVLLARRVRRPR